MAETETVAWPEEFLPVANKKVSLEGVGKVSSAQLWSAALRQHLAIFTRSGKRFWIPEHDKEGYLVRDYAKYVDGFRGKLEVKPISQIKAQEMLRILAAEERILPVKKSAELAAESLLEEETKQSRAKPSKKERQKAKKRQQKITGEPSTNEPRTSEPSDVKRSETEIQIEPDNEKADLPDAERSGEPDVNDPDEGKTDDIEKVAEEGDLGSKGVSSGGSAAAGMSYEGWQLQLEGKRKPVAIEDLISSVNTRFETMKKEVHSIKLRELKGAVTTDISTMI